MDLALIYASGKRAIITLEKDDKAQKLFTDVFAAWGKAELGSGAQNAVLEPIDAIGDAPRCRRHDGSPARWPIFVCG